MNDHPQQNGERRIAELEQRVAELGHTVQAMQLQRGADLQQSVADLREQIRLMQQNNQLEERVLRAGEQATTLSYQQAAEWVRMCNTVTWSLGSIYVVAAVIALNGAMQQGPSAAWRSVAGWLVVFMVIVWAVIDCAYLRSAKSAREYLRNIETSWREQPVGGGFFVRQQGHPSTFMLVTGLLGLSAFLLGVLGLFVAIKPLRDWIGLSP